MRNPQAMIAIGALVVGGLYAYRWLAGGQIVGSKLTPAKLVGIGSRVSPEGFLIAWGAVFLGLSLLSTGAPKMAAALTLLIVITNVITNFGPVADFATEVQTLKTENPSVSSTENIKTFEHVFSNGHASSNAPAPARIKLPHQVDWAGLEKLIRSGVRIDVTKAVEFLRGGGTIGQLETAARHKNSPLTKQLPNLLEPSTP